MFASDDPKCDIKPYWARCHFSLGTDRKVVIFGELHNPAVRGHMQRREFITLVSSAAAVWPLAARAQQPIPIVGFVHTGEAKPNESYVAAFSQGLKDTGHVEGQTVSIEYRWADGHLERIPSLVLELVRRPVAALLTGGGDVPPGSERRNSDNPYCVHYW